ncbi:MAG: hypothetical protein JWP29_5029 [Rhodoferax sp.]|nr:hypothetical protein [Rhodoferax sp.]
MKTFKSTACAAAFLAFGATATNAAPINLVQNGGFETTSVTHSSPLALTGALTQSVVADWQVWAPGGYNYSLVYFPGEATTTGALGISNGLNPNPAVLWAAADSPDGGNFIAIDGDSTVTNVLSQTIHGLTVGQQYDLSFDYAGAQFNVRDGATTEGWLVGFGAAQQTTTVLSNANHGFTGWFKSEMQFTATSTDQLLSFMAKGTPDGFPPVSLIDGVSLTEVPKVAEVPEPASIALMALGLIGLGVSRRSQRTSKAASAV